MDSNVKRICIEFRSLSDGFNVPVNGHGIGFVGMLKSYGSITANALPCFLKNTEIMTNMGNKMIQDIENGDLIVNKEGELKTVLFAGSRMTFNRTSHT